MAGRAPRPPKRDRLGPTRPAGRFAVVAARFNEEITKRLVSGAVGALTDAGLQAAAHLARTGRYAGIVCVGCVIKGQTPHFDFVAGQAAAGIQRVGLDTGVPSAFGVITALTEAQAWERAGGDVGNRGQEAAEAALEMVAFVRDLRRRHGKATKR